MSEGATHCPYIGLKQNRAIRFSTPIAEHRCYINGEATEIPVDQSSYCLSQFHTQCPLYMGSLASPKKADDIQLLVKDRKNMQSAARQPTSLPAREQTPAADRRVVVERSDTDEAPYVPPSRGRSRSTRTATQSTMQIPVAAYGAVIGVLVVAVLLYIFADVLVGNRQAAEPVIEPTVASAATDFEPLPTSAAMTETPADSVAVLLPSATTQVATPAPITVATATFAPRPTARTVSTLTPVPTVANAVATNTTATTVATVATVATAATSSDTVDTPLWLYFADSSGTMLVPVYRTVPVVARRVAGAAVTSMIDGPRAGMQPLIAPETQVKSLNVRDGVAYLDFDRSPSSEGDIRGYIALVHTLTQFSTVKSVQFSINGVAVKNPNIPSSRPRINEWNPNNLSIDEATVLTLYFVSADGKYDIPVTKLVPRTAEIATATINALIGGAGTYADRVKQTIPSDTTIRSIALQNGVLQVDFSAAFANASDRAGAMRTLVESVTTIAGVNGIRVTVEGQGLSGVWSPEFDRVFEARAVNPE